jgi:hypothetical protein
MRAEKITEVLEISGIKLDKWQRDALDTMLTKPLSGLCAPRQNGKTFLILAVCIINAIAEGRTVYYTAHLQSTVNEIAANWIRFFRQPQFKPLIEKLQTALARQQVTFVTGGRIIFSTRNAQAGVGFSVDTLICDESQLMSGFEYSQLAPIVSASKKQPRIIMVGTPLLADDAHRITGSPFQKMKYEGNPNFIAYEAAKYYSPDIDIWDDELFHKANPGYRRVHNDTLQMERETMTHLAFCQQRLGCWLPPQSDIDTHAPAYSKDMVNNFITKNGAKSPRYAVGIGLDDYSKSAYIATYADGVSELVRRFDIEEGGLTEIAGWLAARSRQITTITMRKTGKTDAVKELIAGHKRLWSNTKTLSRPATTPAYFTFKEQLERGTLKVWGNIEARTALGTMWYQQTKSGTTIISAPTKDVETAAQALAMSVAQGASTRPRTTGTGATLI